MAEIRHHKQLVGLVVSTANAKTAVVLVRRRIKHPLYEKFVNRQKRYMAHDEDESCSEGDLVVIQESRPISRRKRWRVFRTLRKATQA